MAGRSLGDVVLPAELEKVSQIQSHFNNEQKRREPNYLPPILGTGSQSIQGLGFTIEDFGRFPLNFHDHMAFVGSNGYARPMAIRAGLAKAGSFYFISKVQIKQDNNTKRQWRGNLTEDDHTQLPNKNPLGKIIRAFDKAFSFPLYDLEQSNQRFVNQQPGPVTNGQAVLT
ncbi:hypothetical protein VCV18_000587 [Metarhizium anisopliae]